LIAATIAMGLMAGVFGIYSNALMPGLRRTDDRTFVSAFQAIDKAIINPLFMTSFFVALLLPALSAGLHLGHDERSVFPWTVAAFALYLVVFIITLVVHVPLNDGIKGAGDPNHIADLAAVRARFNEARWIRWNIVRTTMSTAALGCLAWALVLHGRASALTE
jgi:uncharacterized membrane protein